MTCRVFISYRGDDSGTAAVVIDRELTGRLGGDRVFLDSRSIPAGADFVDELLGRLRDCSVLVVVIGPHWLTLTDKTGRRRIDNPQDWIRREIAEALSHGLRVIPVLTADTALPAEADLPEDIAELSRRQAVPLRHRYTTVDLAYLSERITEADPELAKVAASRRSSGGRVPRQLPAAVAHFAGRAGHLAALTRLLPGRDAAGHSGVISAISGTAGVGKTALAVYWAHQVADRFPDGHLYVNLHGFDPSGQVMPPAEAVRRFLDAMRVPPERIPVDLDEQAALYRSELAGKQVLVLLDNARDTAQVRPLLPGAPGCLVVVTSRNQLTSLIAIDGADPITLDLLTDDEAQQLLARRLGADRVAAEPAAVEEIITRCARLPLALALVAARAAVRPHAGLQALAEELRDTRYRWQMLTGDEPTSDVQAVFSWSYLALTPPAARLFRLLGLHPGQDITAPAAASLAGLAVSTVRPGLAELMQASLLVEQAPGRYVLHDLLWAYASDLAQGIDTGQQRRAATHRFLDHYLHTAYTAGQLLLPATDPITLSAPQPGVTLECPADDQQALDWFTTERPVLLAAVNHAATTGFDTYTWQLAWTLTIFLDRQGHWHDWVAVGRAAVAGARRLTDQAAQGHAYRILAYAYTRVGRYDDAHAQLNHALDLAIQTGDQTAQAHTHYTQALLWERQGNYAGALDHAQQALTLHRVAGHPIEQAVALNAVGWCHARLGDQQRALTHCQQALSLLQELGDRTGQADTWDSIGYAHHHLGDHPHALASYHNALTLWRELGDRYSEADTLGHLGDTHQATGDHGAARGAWQQALAILDDLDHPDADQVRAKLASLDTQSPGPADGGAQRDNPEDGAA